MIFKCPSTKPCAAARTGEIPTSTKNRQPAIRYFSNDDTISKKWAGQTLTYPAQITKPTLRQCQLPGAAAVRRGVEFSRARNDRKTCDLNHRKTCPSDYPIRRAIRTYQHTPIV